MRRRSTADNGQGDSKQAAAYVRMSTDHQKYSTENQLTTIERYAEQRGLLITEIFEDSGRSGLRVDDREGLQRLMREVQTGQAAFSAILVYDVSRWGRFQDADEGAYYEHVCSRAGIRVHYCGEQFDNDGSIGSVLLKSVKRVMAGEYSRELSVKVFAGQCRLIELGFRQGGPAGYGLRRQLIDENRIPKAILNRGDRKSLQTDRVVLTLGPTEEVEQIHEIYSLFVERGRSEAEIASYLNADGGRTDFGRPWTRASVHQILTNEKYIGNNVFNRVSFKLKQKRVANSPETWVRSESAFPAVVSRALFERAHAIIDARSAGYSDEELLALLQTVLDEEGYLSGVVIDERDDVPSASVYRRRFGSLTRAYSLIGYVPDRDYSYIEVNRRIRDAHPTVVSKIVNGFELAGGHVSRDESQLLIVNGQFSAAIVIARAASYGAGYRWHIRLDTGLFPDLTIAVRLCTSNTDILDYYVFPSLDLTIPHLKLAQDNALSLDAYRFEALDFLYSLARQCSFGEAA
ncbi:recombinase family protein [Bradyrhizobium septentrionale]|uniref:recombinase family protein n=1 Tax=Bradyrhizobium septentrionale TaxID=1404411 RepID=UPI0015964B6A|nr:recombinase family protein [Bradyrhizobium septentrionale]UGY27736.1 recombinase family protein [Bradyrhizobium septentrionale]